MSLEILNKNNLDTCFQVLIKKNSERIKKASLLPKPEGHFSTEKFLEFFLVTCNVLELPKQVTYLATEIFEIFMPAHLNEMYKFLDDQNYDKEKRKAEVEKILERLKDQAKLRALSCIQIASKHHSHYNHVSVDKLCSELKRQGYKYRQASVKKSELRVLKTIGFSVDFHTPYDFLQALIFKLESELKMNEELTSRYLKDSTEVLDLVLIKKGDIYRTFAQLLTSYDVSSQDDNKLIYALQSDYLFMAASVIVASSFLLQYHLSNQLTGLLHQWLLINADKLTDMASIILQTLQL